MIASTIRFTRFCLRGTNSSLSTLHHTIKYKATHNTSTNRLFCNISDDYMQLSNGIIDDTDYDSIRQGDPDPDGDEDPNIKGWDLVLQRTHDLVKEVSEQTFNKTLHLYCHKDFVLGFGEKSKYSIAGLTDSESAYKETSVMPQYQDSVQLVDLSASLPCNYHEFQLIISLPHPERDVNSPVVSAHEISRILNEDGFCVMGAPAKVWKNGLANQLEECEKQQKIRIYSMQYTELDDYKCLYYTALIRGGGD